MNWINSEYIKSADETEAVKLIMDKISKDENLKDILVNPEYVRNVYNLMKERVYTINDFTEFGKYFFTDPVTYDEKGLAKHWNEAIKPVFENYVKQLESTEDWESAILEEKLRNFAEANGIKAAQLIHILRLSVTGITVSPGIFEVLELIGKKTVLNRLFNFLSKN